MAKPTKEQQEAAKRAAEKAKKAAEKAAKEREDRRQGARTTSLEAGKTLARFLSDAPGAKAVGKTVDAASEKQAQRVLSLCAGITLRVAPVAVTKAEVNARIDVYRRTLSVEVPLAFGEAVKGGDEVQLDVTGYVDGHPFLAQTGQWYAVSHNPHLPGLFEALVNTRPGDTRLVPVTLPQTYPVEALRGKMAAIAVAVKAGKRRTLPAVDSPLFTGGLGVQSNAELEERVREELLREHAHDMVNTARALLLRKLYIASPADPVDEIAVGEELTQRWRQDIGENLILQGIPVDEQKRSQAEYAQDEVLHAEARRCVWEVQVLEAVAAVYGIDPDERDLTQVLGKNGAQALEAFLERSPQQKKSLLRALKHQRATDVLLGAATVDFAADKTESIGPLVQKKSADDRFGVTATRGLKRPPSKAR